MHQTGLSHWVAGFCDFLDKSGRVRFDLPARFHGPAYRLFDGNTEIPVADGILLIGDSAGWVASAAARLLTTRWFAKRFVIDQFFLR